MKKGLKRRKLLDQVKEDLENPEKRERVEHYQGSGLERHNQEWTEEELKVALLMHLEGYSKKEILHAIRRGKEYIRKLRALIQREDISLIVNLEEAREQESWTERDYWVIDLAFKPKGLNNQAANSSWIAMMLGRSRDSVHEELNKIAKTQKGLGIVIRLDQAQDIRAAFQNCRNDKDRARLLAEVRSLEDGTT